MSGELQPESEPETVYDSGYRADLSSARHVLAFMLTPLAVFGPVGPEETEAAAELINEAKRQAFVEWQRLNRR